MMNVFTIDLEDYFHVSAFADRISINDWTHQEQRVEIGTQRLLALLDRFQVRATFFVLGWVAARNRGLVRRIQSAGHEIASHSYHHRLVYDLTPDEFRDDLRRSRSILEDITGEPVLGYRAPSFSIVRKSLWALEILAEEGFRFDSSIYPIRHDRYGIRESQIGPHEWNSTVSSRKLWEFPGTVARVGRSRIPVGGGGYFRLYPYWLSAILLHRAVRQSHLPFVFYVHPWELDPDQPVLPGPWFRRLRHRANVSATERRLERLLSEFRFGAMSDVLEELSWENMSGTNPGGGSPIAVDDTSPSEYHPAPIPRTSSEPAPKGLTGWD